MNYFFDNPNPKKLFTYNISLKKKIIVNESNLVSIKNSLQKSLRKLKFFEAQQSTMDLKFNFFKYIKFNKLSITFDIGEYNTYSRCRSYLKVCLVYNV